MELPLSICNGRSPPGVKYAVILNFYCRFYINTDRQNATRKVLRETFSSFNRIKK